MDIVYLGTTSHFLPNFPFYSTLFNLLFYSICSDETSFTTWTRTSRAWFNRKKNLIVPKSNPRGKNFTL